MIKIVEIIGKPSAILHSDGLKLYDGIVNEFKSHGKIELSFEGITHCTTAFLNASLGKFLINIPDVESVAKKIKFSGIEDDSLIKDKLKLVTENSLNSKARESFDQSIREVFYA